MANPLIKLMEIARRALQRQERGKVADRRRDQFVGGSRAGEIAKASPERAGELAGHPVERVDT